MSWLMCLVSFVTCHMANVTCNNFYNLYLFSSDFYWFRHTKFLVSANHSTVHTEAVSIGEGQWLLLLASVTGDNRQTDDMWQVNMRVLESLIISTYVKRFSVSHMLDFFLKLNMFPLLSQNYIKIARVQDLKRCLLVWFTVLYSTTVAHD